MDIRKFFSRKRKNSDNDGDSVGPAKKKRKLLNRSENKTESKKEKKIITTETKETQQTNQSNQSNNDSKKTKENEIIPAIKSLEIEQQQQINNDDNEQKCFSEKNDDEDEYMEDIDESASDDDDDITIKQKSKSLTTNNSNNNHKETTVLSKIKKESLKESCAYSVVDECGFTSSSLIEYKVISELFEKMSATTKRLEKIEIMSRLFRSILLLRPSELLYAIYLCCNEIAPPYAGIELGVGDSVILKALCESTGRKLRDIKADYTKCGDLGDVAVKCRSKQNTLFKPKPLTIKNVFETFKKIASTKGNGTQQEKVRNIQRVFVAATGAEARYIVRHLQGKLRIGVNEQTVLSALGRALAFNASNIGIDTDDNDNDNKTNKKQKKKNKKINYQQLSDLENKYTAIIKSVISQLPNYEMVIPSLLKYGINDLEKHCHLTSGIPIKAMLAKPTKGIDEILKRFENMRFTLEYKYDGERAQIHLLPDGSIKIFSRNAENNTQKFPELVESMNKFKNDDIKSFIIDSEVVAYDRINKKILPFSKLMTRKRKNVSTEDIKISVCIYAFDCLLINDESLINKAFNVRRDFLHKSFKKMNGEFEFAHHLDTDDADEITDFLNKAIEDYCEGLMIKTLDIDATYEPSRRSHNWLKCKKDYLEGVGDTLDLVVMGAFHGTGKRTGYYGSYLVGCYNEDGDSYQSCCKVATGLKDDDLKSLDAELKQYLVSSKPIDYETNFECDVWFEPKCVWEIKCADFTISPVHLAAVGLAHESKGIALRFPRYLNRRPDKTTIDATSAEQMHEMYLNQAQLN